MVLVCFLSFLGAILFSWLSGYLFEYHGPPSLMYLILGYSVVATLFFILMYLVGRYNQRRKHTKKDTSRSNVYLEEDYVMNTYL